MEQVTFGVSGVPAPKLTAVPMAALLPLGISSRDKTLAGFPCQITPPVARADAFPGTAAAAGRSYRVRAGKNVGQEKNSILSTEKCSPQPLPLAN